MGDRTDREIEIFHELCEEGGSFGEVSDAEVEVACKRIAALEAEVAELKKNQGFRSEESAKLDGDKIAQLIADVAELEIESKAKDATIERLKISMLLEDKATIERLRRLLREVVSYLRINRIGCPFCDKWLDDHADDCRLAAALKEESDE